MNKPKELCVLSGKGGTGKTSLVGALASLIPDKILVDCDVDAPDLHLLLAPKVKSREEFMGGRKAVIIPELCTDCGRCREVCRFEAISEDFRVDPTSCEGCGVCMHFCSFGAIEFPLALCGEWFVSETRFGPMVHAQLGAGQENSGLLVALIRGKAQDLAQEKGLPLILVDGPPGIGCPVISSLTGADGVLIVTEPTLSGLHDLNRVLDLAGHFKIPGMVLINKYDLNQEMTDRIETYCQEKGLGLAGRLPYDPVVTEAMVQGKTIPEMEGNSLGAEISKIWERIQGHLLKN
ncbi:MAG: (4Fe-4S)-binding protein [Deltaproteobacteria bacterium RBG_13_43_22]|nr:MAG: (4Fe-4S)-binding protein [Deltaproteobacteria bacterium RBG_13_43_22]